jgi:hypothetical protein
MSEAAALEEIADEMDAILRRFVNSRNELWIADGDQAKYTSLVLEARDAMAQSLGYLNDFGLQLESVRREGTRNFSGSQSYQSVEQGVSIVRAAANSLRRRARGPVNQPSGRAAAPSYVNLVRIEELRSTNSASWDLRRLVRMCEELNSSFAAENYLASAMLLRAIVDHVPPIFAASSFNQFASSIAGMSIEKSMERLQTSSRHISDRWLHEQVRRKESLPNGTQVDFRQDLDVLLAEVVAAAR